METLPATQEDSSGANPSSVKSDDSSPGPNSGRGSPPPNCAICLGTCKNKSFTDSCLHQFCFKCLLTWSKVKAVCPLCKQNFRSIIHNVRSNHQYEEYLVEQRQTEDGVERLLEMDAFTLPSTRRFRYRTTFTLPRRETITIQQLLLHYPLVAEAFPRTVPPRRRRSPTSFRRTVYRHNLWARPLPDFTGRFRDCSPEFYRYNETQMHRLVPWLDRELHYLLNENLGHISYVLNRILELLRQYHINSPEFREAMSRYFGDRTEHFLHELYCFASTPYDMTGYDRNVQYTTDTRISTMVNEVISSSDSDVSMDSDIMMVSSSEPSEAPPGPSRTRTVPSTTLVPGPAPAYPHNYIPTPLQASTQPPQPTQNVIPIETFSQSSSDDDSSEVLVVGYIKPPQDRTPEVVDLLGSDSDVVIQESPPPARVPEPEQPLLTVKLSMKMHQPRESRKSDSDDSHRAPSPPTKRRRHAPSADVATTSTSDTCQVTPSPPVSSSSTNQWDDSDSSCSPSLRWSSSSFSSDSDSSTFSDYSTSDDDSSWSRSNAKRSKSSKRKSKKKSSKERSVGSRSRDKYRKRTPPNNRYRTKKDKRSKHKSHSGKGVKSSKKASVVNETINTAQTQVSEEQPGPSGISANQKCKSRDKSSKKRKETTDTLTPVYEVNYEEQPGPSYLSSNHSQKSNKDKYLKKSKDSHDQGAHTKNYTNEDQQPGCSETLANHKQKTSRDKLLKKSNETVDSSELSYKQVNEEQIPCTSSSSSSHKDKSSKSFKKSKDPLNMLGQVGSHANEDQPGAGPSGTHKHRSNREKHSKKNVTPNEEEQQAGPSGTSNNLKCKSSRDKTVKAPKEASPKVQTDEDQAVSKHKHKSSRDRKRRRPSRENKRLKSVVNIMYNNSYRNAGEITQGSPGGISNTSNHYDNLHSENAVRKVKYESPPLVTSPVVRPTADSSDSEDDLPLNLTIQNSLTYTQL